MARRYRLLFLQLPYLDNDVAGPRENLPMAGLYLAHALRRSGESRHWDVSILPPEADDEANDTLSERICGLRPDVIACTLYLWNIERTLRVIRELRERLPSLRVVAGGPETARPHPFLFRYRLCDIVVVGEGEAVFPHVLRFFRGGAAPSFSTVAVRRGRRYVWGTRCPGDVRLSDALPPAAGTVAVRTAVPTAYIETTRGCPMRCTYCRYSHLRRRLDAVPTARVLARVRALAGHGVREIRFVDPTMNTHPQFEEIVAGLAGMNRDGHMRFFAELRGDTVTEAQATSLAQANFHEIEIGMQSRDPAVLRAVRRPTRLDALERGIRALGRNGIRVTLDVMYGLPRQGAADVYESIAWGQSLPNVHVQCMQTLLLPGTALRARSHRWGMDAGRLPPYGVRQTSTLHSEEIAAIEAHIRATPGLPSGVPTARFTGRRLPDLFPEQHRVVARETDKLARIPGHGSRRALIFLGDDLFACRDAIVRTVRRAVREAPDTLWQVVLRCETEEPLNALDAMAAELTCAPPQVFDRFACVRWAGRVASRRVFCLLKRGVRFDSGWVQAAEDTLSRVYY